MFKNLFDFVGGLVLRLRHSEGQTMAEYGILIAVIALIVVVAAITLGGNLKGLFNSAAASA